MVTDLVIPEGVADIKAYAFSNCIGLTSVTISYSVTSIGEGVFSYCSGLTSIEIPNSVTSIGDYAFSICTGLTSLEIPNSVTSIGGSAFTGCSGLTSIEIPNSVTSIGDYAFSGCSGLASITIPNSVTSIGSYAFSGCTGLTSLEIPNSVTSIEEGVFQYCFVLESIVVENGNSVYDSRDNCNAIIETATNELIAGCKNTVIPSNVTSIGNFAFSGCSGLTSIEIPNSVTSIGHAAFSNCSGLTSIEIPNSVTSIGNSAFSGCSGLTSIEIPNSVTSIGDYAFYNCTGLTSITSYIQLENIIYNAPNFMGLRSFDICTIYVPYGTAWAYERDMFCKNVVEMAMTASNLDALYNEVLEYASAIIDDNEFNSHGVISDSTQLSTNAQEKTEGPISNLLDSDIETFFHSSWSSESDPVNGYHYLQVDLGEALDAIEIKYSKRMNNTMKDYNPEYVEVTATNNVDGEWTLIGNYHWDYDFMTDTVEAGHATYVMDNAYRHVRITVKRAIESYAHLTTPPFFNLSEFGVWKSAFDASHPTYSDVPAMLMDELQAAMAEAKEKLSAREHSEATFNRLKKAFEDVVEFKTTDVEEVKSENGKVKTIYDLQGRRVKEASQPGIYIINGKKTLIK